VKAIFLLLAASMVLTMGCADLDSGEAQRKARPYAPHRVPFESGGADLPIPSLEDLLVAPRPCLSVHHAVQNLGVPTGQLTFPDGSMVLEWDTRQTMGAIFLPGLFTSHHFMVPMQSGEFLRMAFDPKGCRR
jgi:hypothetical protein